MILIVDDDPSVTTSLSLLLRQNGYRAQAASNPTDALALLASQLFQLVMLDMNFSRRTTGEEGLAVLQQIKAAHPTLPVILLTAWGSIQLAVAGVRAGASDFITKPWTHPQLLQAVKTALELTAAHATQTPHPTREKLAAQYEFHDLIGNDPKFLRLLEVVGRVAATDASVLITGESGTGKELIAEAIHRNSKRASQAFIKVNLGGIPAQLFESEMFGHVKGAFTDARADRKGRFEMADGGTIFLDEIGDLDPSAQVKLLRVLQDRTYEVLGSSVTRSVNVRVISATNRNLAELVASGQFREDLLYRLNLIAVQLPPLRERATDIPPIAQHFLQTMSQVYQRTGLRISHDALHWLQALPWPGNIRQLKHLIERTILVSGKDVLEVQDFRLPLEMEGGESNKDALPQVGAMTLEEMEKAMILKALKHHHGNISRVAEALGMSRAALYRRLEKFEIEI